MTAALNAPTNAPRVLILAGTTASGKTDVSIPLAELLKGEIVNADSRQVYRELEIGTAKPSAEQLARVRHHFISEKSIGERWTAGDFTREARQRITEILERGHVPVVVGGSMLYLRALLDGFYEAELEEQADYGALRAELAARGGEALYAELTGAGPGAGGADAAARFSPHPARAGGQPLQRSYALGVAEPGHAAAGAPIPAVFSVWRPDTDLRAG